MLRRSLLPLRATHIERLPPLGGAMSSVWAPCRTLTGEGKRRGQNKGWSEDSAALCHTALSEALIGIKELSTGLMSPLLHCTVVGGQPPLCQTCIGVSVCTYTHTDIQRLGGASTQRGLIPVQHIYVTNTFICRSLPNEL